MFALVGAFFLTAMSAHASHFRGASLTWKKLATPANTIEVTVTESWANNTGNTYTWGDGQSFSAAGGQIIASGTDSYGTFFVKRTVATHTYSGLGPWTIQSTGCCRIAFINSNQTSWTLQAVVDMRNGNQGSPVISTPIVLQMVRGGLNTVPLSFADVDGDPVTFRMATAAESSITGVASAGGNTLSVSPSGVLTWDTSFTVVNQRYAVQVIANDNHPGTPVGGAKVFFDFMIHIVDGSLNKPPVASGNSGPFTAAIGVPFSNVITGTDPDGGTLRVTHLGLPNGATLSPVSGTSGPQPLAATFSWTPTLADANSSVGVTLVFTDPGGLQASKSFSISVPANQAPVANAGADRTVFDTDANQVRSVVTLNGGASFDPEGAPLTYSWTQTGGPAVTLSNANTATPSFTAPSLHEHPSGIPAPELLLMQLSVSDGNSTRLDDVLITVKHNNAAPIASATAPATAPEGTPVTLDGSASSDPDMDSLSFTWSQLSGSPVSLAPNGTNNPTIDITSGVVGPHSIPGELLEFQLTVNDGIANATSTVVPVFIQNVNQAPVTNAGDDLVVFDNAGEVELHGHAQDPDGDTITLQWTQVAGPAVVLEHADEDHAHFIAPAVSPEQGSVTLTFQLVASDAIDGNDAAALISAPATVNVLVKHANRAPVADAGANKSVPEQTLISLDGSGSFDPDQDAIATYSWTQVAGPAVVLDTTDPIRPSFTAPDVNAAGLTLAFELVVTDTPAAGSGGSLSSAPGTVVITVKYVNRPPTADADAPQSVNEGTITPLTGSGSDPDGNTFTFAWTQTGGTAVAISDAAAANPTFTAPLVDRFGEVLVFALQVTDEFGAVSNVATTSVNVLNINHAPIADAGETQSVPEDTLVNLAGLAADPDTEEQSLLTYAWTQTDGPTVSITGDTTTSPSFQAPVVTAGGDPLARVSLKFKLTATDPNGASSFDEVEVVVANIDNAPIANAGGITLLSEAATYYLDGRLSRDPDGDALTYAWVQTAGPTVGLNNADTATPSLTAPFVGAAGATLKFKLTVEDGYGGSSSDIATVNVNNINDPPTVTGAAASMGCLWPPNHQMVAVGITGVIDPNNNATITITGVTQDEATNGLGDGDTAIDAIINPNGTVLLRAERSGKGNGRVYHIHFTASDVEGGASGMVTVCVPHSKKTTAVIDGGELFDSTR